jgi:hypothetical protein
MGSILESKSPGQCDSGKALHHLELQVSHPKNGVNESELMELSPSLKETISARSWDTVLSH